MKEQIAQQPGTMRNDTFRQPVYRGGEPQKDDMPYFTEEDDAFYNTRQSSSVVKRCKVPPTPAQTRTQKRTVMRVTQHEGPPPQPTRRASRTTTQTPQPRQQAKQTPVKHTWRFHWLFYVGVGMVAMLVLWMVGSTAVSFAHAEHDNLTYGYPRTFQMDANVDHDGISHFIVVNLHGHIIITEMHENNLAETKIYQGPVFSDNDADTLVATLSFKDVNGDGKPDMIIAVNNQRFIMINTGNAFRPTTPSDHMSQEVN